MAEEGVYKAEVIYVQDPEEGQLGETLKNTTKSEVSILVYSVRKVIYNKNVMTMTRKQAVEEI